MIYGFLEKVNPFYDLTYSRGHNQENFEYDANKNVVKIFNYSIRTYTQKICMQQIYTKNYVRTVTNILFLYTNNLLDSKDYGNKNRIKYLL